MERSLDKTTEEREVEDGSRGVANAGGIGEATYFLPSRDRLYKADLMIDHYRILYR